MYYIELLPTLGLALALAVTLAGRGAQAAVYGPTAEEVARFAPSNLQKLFGLAGSKVLKEETGTEPPASPNKAKKTIVKYYPVYVPVPPPTAAPPTTEQPDHHHHHGPDPSIGPGFYPPHYPAFYPSSWAASPSPSLSFFGQFGPPTTSLVPGYFPERFHSPRGYGRYGRPYVPHPDYYIDINRYPIRSHPASYGRVYRPSYDYDFAAEGDGYRGYRDYDYDHAHSRHYRRRPAAYDGRYEYTSKRRPQEAASGPQPEEPEQNEEQS